jgi:diadenosine tetraphosphate (Ap4A) HIT family hydrolase
MAEEKLMNFDNARDPLQVANMQKIEAEGFCPFCPEHMEKYHTPPILKRGTHWYVTPNMYPYEHAVHHLLFITNRHISNSLELTSEEWAELQVLLHETIGEQGLTHGTLLMRSGDMKKTGSSVLHLHAQLVVGSGDNEKPVMTRVG